MVKSKEKSAFFKIFLPFLVSFVLVFVAFSLFTLLKFRNYEVPILRKEFYALFFSFMIVYSILTFGLVLWLYYRIKKVSTYAGEISKGRKTSELSEKPGGVLHHLISNIDAMSEELKDRAQSAGWEKNRILAILESMIEGVLVVDRSQKIIMVNSALSVAFGLKKEDLRGKYFWEVFRDTEINEMIKKSLEVQSSFKKEHAALLTGSVFEIQVSPVFGDREFLGAAAVFHDVTKVKKLEKAQSEFVANVSHELKTPLTSIIGFVETLKEGAMEDPKNRVKFLRIIEDHSKRLNHLIEDLLILSKMESGKQALKTEVINLDKMIENIVEYFEKPIRDNDLRVAIEVAPMPFIFSGDQESLEQILTNLIDNAIKYNKPGGNIRVRASFQGDAVKIEIKDTGIGIPETDLPRIFERFYRVDKSRSRESGGTGLGLSIVKHIVEKLSGKIEVYSEPNQGSSFILTLPKS